MHFTAVAEPISLFEPYVTLPETMAVTIKKLLKRAQRILALRPFKFAAQLAQTQPEK